MTKIKMNKTLKSQTKIAGTALDKRVKLSPEQKEIIMYEYKNGASKRSLSLKYGVSRRLIQFITEPEKLQIQREKAKERKPNENKITVKKYRSTSSERHKKYKKFLIVSGKINKAS